VTGAALLVFRLGTFISPPSDVLRAHSLMIKFASTRKLTETSRKSYKEERRSFSVHQTPLAEGIIDPTCSTQSKMTNAYILVGKLKCKVKGKGKVIPVTGRGGP
jgi:hypothetical protein